ncbi:hypothetical protein E4U32_000361 [Claviceps aff. humidiphila group G2b]|nr:hypothetical protein E4U32_000361 [Claviceps aff. humidiphila group G2b]
MRIPQNQCPKQETHPQPQIEGKLDNLTKGVADIPSKVCDEFMKRYVQSEEKFFTKRKEAEGLRSEIQSLKAQLQQEKADRQDKVEQLQKKSTEAKGLRSELQSLREQLQRQKAISQEKVDELTTTIQRLDEDKKLRKVILGNALRLTISDDEMRERFVNIRQQIHTIVNNRAYDNTREFMPRDAAKDSMRSIHQRYNSYGLRDRVLYLRSMVYQIIFHHILRVDAFGLAGSVPPLECNQEAPEAVLDRALGIFEDLLRTRKANEVISDWRLATFKCIENFSAALPPRDTSIARDEIERFLLPLLNFKLGPVKIRTEISQLCDDAFALWLLARKSGDRYQFDGPKIGTKYAKGFLGTEEVCGVIGNGDASKYIEFSICGALTKKTGNEESKVTYYVLEPAHVMLEDKKNESLFEP